MMVSHTITPKRIPLPMWFNYITLIADKRYGVTRHRRATPSHSKNKFKTK